MKHLGITQKLRWAVLNQPILIPSILNDSRYDKKLFQHILFEMIPRRTSIEIECTGSLAKALNMNNKDICHTKNWGDILTHVYPLIAKKYNVFEYAEDDRGRGNVDYDEHKISILNYTQIIGLYNILNDMKQYTSLTSNSGTHIHLDVSKLIPKGNRRSSEIDHFANFFTKKCKDGSVETIFGKCPSTIEDYEKVCMPSSKLNGKGNWLHLNQYYQSLEFRTGAMTFDYSTIIKYFISVNKLLNEYEQTLHLVQAKESPIYKAC